MGSKDKTDKEKANRINNSTSQPSTTVHIVNNVNTVFIDKLKCAYTNADSLPNKMLELKSIVQIEHPQLIAITEVKPKNFKEISLAEFHIKGYELHPVNLENKIGRGVLIYVHESIKVNDIDLIGDYVESCWIELNLVKHDKLLIGCIYRSDSGSQENNEMLLELFRHSMSLNYSHYLIIGDFNFNKISWDNWYTSRSESSNEYKFIECIRDCFLYQHVTRPTRYRADDEPSIIDLIFTNEENMVSDLKYYSPLGRSDHSVLIFDYNCYLEVKHKPRMQYFYDRGDYEAMKSDLDINWTELFANCTDDVETQWNLLKTKLSASQEIRIPHKMQDQKPRWKERGDVPLDAKALKAIHEKHRAWERAYKSRNEISKQKYNRQRNKVRSLTRHLHKDFEKGIAKDAKRNPKRFWQYVKSKTKTKSSVAQLQIPTDPDSNTGKPVLTENDKQKAEVLSAFFSTVFTKEPLGEVPTIPAKIVQEQLDSVTITEELIIKKLAELNVNKSPGPDSIHPRVLKELASSLSVPLNTIFNTSVRTKMLPNDWKLANVTAVFKKGKKYFASNYRPISLTSIACKLLESIVRDCVISHLKANKLFSNKQFGFISGRSTTLQLLHVLDTWTNILDEGGHLDSIYLDFMKAFDTVPHRRLISKIMSYGITDPIVGWISSFLNGRQQKVCVNGETSSWSDVSSGIPQGSVLGPLLFVIYINDLPEVVEHSEAYLFADDTKIFKDISTEQDCVDLQSDFHALQQWSNKWLLKFHPDKCEVLHISTSRSTGDIQNYPYSMPDGDETHFLKHKPAIKDLGVTVDGELSFEQHIQEKVNKANSMMGLIRRTFTYLDEESFLSLYKALVRPHLEFASMVWSPHKIKDITALENVQRRATRLVPGLNKMSYEARLRKLHLPTLIYRRLRGDMISVYKNFNICDPEVALNLQLSHVSTRGHTYKLFVKRPRLDIRKYFFSYRIVSPWNSLDQSVVSSPNVQVFEARLDRHWRTEDIVYDYRAAVPGTIKKVEPNIEAQA